MRMICKQFFWQSSISLVTVEAYTYSKYLYFASDSSVLIPTKRLEVGFHDDVHVAFWAVTPARWYERNPQSVGQHQELHPEREAVLSQ
jgi:hypothetical protein